MFKKKTLVLALAILSFAPFFNANSQVDSSLNAAYSPESEIPHAIGVYITGRGQDKIFNSLPEIMKRNGLSVSQAYFHKQHFEMEEKPLEAMLPESGALRDAALKIKETLQRFLLGLEFNDHKFSLDIEGIYVNIDWEDVYAELDQQAKDYGQLKLKLVFEAKGININVAKFRIEDLNNDLLGKVGFDDLELLLKDQSVPLRFEIPVVLENNTNKTKGPILRVGNLSSNIQDADIDVNFNGKVMLPQIELRINDRVIKANYTELESMLKTNEEKIVLAIKNSMQSWIEDDSAVLLNKTIASNTTEGLFQEVNVMDPAGAPEDQLVAPFEWGIKFKEYDFVGDNIHLTLDGYLKDPIKGFTRSPESTMATKAPNQVDGFSHNDFVLSINEGFINRIVQLSYNRGYFNSFQSEDGESYKIAKVPVFKFKGASDKKPSRLAVELEYTVTGAGAALVKNPIRINFDMTLAFPVENGKVKMIATDIDMDSVKVDKKYIRNFLWLVSWSGVVMPQVRKRFESARNDVRGMILNDEFPIPESMVGLPLIVKDTTIDSNGHLMIQIDTELE